MQAALQRPALARPRPLRKGGLQTRSMSTSNPSHVAQPLSSPNKTSQNQQAPPTRQETEKLFSSSSKSGANLSALQHPRLSHSHSLSTYTYIYIHIYVKNLYIYLHNGRVCSPNEGLSQEGGKRSQSLRNSVIGLRGGWRISKRRIAVMDDEAERL